MVNFQVFSDDSYNELVIMRVEKSFNTLLPFAAIISILLAVQAFFSSIPIHFSIVDLLLGIFFLVIHLNRHSVQIKTKIMSFIISASLVAILGFTDGGFSSAFITLFIISNMLAVLFLPKKISLVFSLIHIILFIGLWVYSLIYLAGTIHEIANAYIIIQFTVFVLCLLVLHISVYSVRDYLLESIIELEHNVEQSNKLAYFDQLTGLMNAYKFKDELASNIMCKGYLILFNLKGLALINSIYGEEKGDLVLKETAHILKELLDENDLLARISGNEFAVWSDINEKGVLYVKLNYIISEFKDRFMVPNMNKKIDFYISYSDLSQCSTSINSCYQKATMALTFAKTNDINEYVAYDEKLSEILYHEESIKDLIEPAIHNKEFKLFYQPKVNPLNNSIVGVEALSRWNSKILGFVSPGEFIPIIEKINQSVKFGNYVLNKALGDYQNLCLKYGKDINLSINISPSHIISKDFTINLNELIHHYNVPANKITLEITEEIMIKELDLVISIINNIKNIGVEIALDDFGTGYSSLNYLTQLEIDELKIDKSFISQIENNERMSIMLSNIINLSNQYGLRIVCEGVETEKQKDLIVNLGCHIIQGYYYYRPEALE